MVSRLNIWYIDLKLVILCLLKFADIEWFFAKQKLFLVLATIILSVNAELTSKPTIVSTNLGSIHAPFNTYGPPLNQENAILISVPEGSTLQQPFQEISQPISRKFLFS